MIREPALLHTSPGTGINAFVSLREPTAPLRANTRSPVTGLHGAASHYHNVWDSHLPELGVPTARNVGSVAAAGGGGPADDVPSKGFGVPRVDSLYPAVCPIAIYDCTTQW